jgi:hypothetical protein
MRHRLASLVALAAVATALAAGCGQGSAPSPTPRPCVSGASSAPFALPSHKGLNYGTPDTAGGEFVGTEWLRSGTGSSDHWSQTRPALAADLDFIQRQRLGKTLRLFIGLDQAMRWNGTTGFQGFHPQVLDNLQTALSMVAAHDMKAIVVLYDQEVVASLGNFRFAALDGHHPAMRAGYVNATREFMARFGGNPAVAGWDLFNEAYDSLGTNGGLPPPGHPDPVSPGYPDPTIHQFLRDLYGAAKCAAPRAWLTVSDSSHLTGGDGDTGLFSDVVDFYDLHTYDDSPRIIDLRRLGKPAIYGEVGASLEGDHLAQPAFAAPAIAAALREGRDAGARAVLASNGGAVFTPDRTLTAAGRVIAEYPE